MALYQIRRDVGEISSEDMDAAAFRAILCAPQFPGVKWHRSYWNKDAGRIECVYEADRVSDLEAHAQAARIPCDEVNEVTELLPETYLHG
jgi:hypothetical protein